MRTETVHGRVGKVRRLLGDLATLEHNVLAKVECLESNIESRITALAVEYKRTRWMVATLLALCMVILLEIFLR